MIASKDYVEALQSVGDQSLGETAEANQKQYEFELTGLIAKLDACEEIIQMASKRLEKQIDSIPESTNISLSIVIEAYEDIIKTRRRKHMKSIY